MGKWESKVSAEAFAEIKRCGRRIAANEIARPILTPFGSFDPKKGAMATTGATRIKARKKKVSAVRGEIPGRLKTKLT